MTRDRHRRGLNAVELAIAVAVVGLVVLYLLLALPRSRESSRRLTCQRNLMQIGVALGLYHQVAGHFPIARLDATSPHGTMLDTLGQPDFLGLTDRAKTPNRIPGFVLFEKRVRGFVCPSDSAAFENIAAPISYRANTGASVDGQGGPFALGARTTIEAVESSRGASFTAGFSERILGGGTADPSAAGSYHRVAAPVDPGGCIEPIQGRTLGDAGHAWLLTSWRDTLYNHARPPARPETCIADDGRTGVVPASSYHPSNTNVLMLDGSVRSYGNTVAESVWNALGTLKETPP